MARAVAVGGAGEDVAVAGDGTALVGVGAAGVGAASDGAKAAASCATVGAVAALGVAGVLTGGVSSIGPRAQPASSNASASDTKSIRGESNPSTRNS